MTDLPFYFSCIKRSDQNDLGVLPFWGEPMNPDRVYSEQMPLQHIGYSTSFGKKASGDAWPFAMKLMSDIDVLPTLEAWGVAWAGMIPVVSEKVASTLIGLNLGESEVRALPLLAHDSSDTGKTIRVLASMEQIDTAVADPEAGFGLRGLFKDGIGSSVFVSCYEAPPEGVAIPCRFVKLGFDLWVDPLWSNSLFFSERLVGALSDISDAEKMLSTPD
jgi:hypothetical protein